MSSRALTILDDHAPSFVYRRWQRPGSHLPHYGDGDTAVPLAQNSQIIYDRYTNWPVLCNWWSCRQGITKSSQKYFHPGNSWSYTRSCARAPVGLTRRNQEIGAVAEISLLRP